MSANCAGSETAAVDARCLNVTLSTAKRSGVLKLYNLLTESLSPTASRKPFQQACHTLPLASLLGALHVELACYGHSQGTAPAPVWQLLATTP